MLSSLSSLIIHLIQSSGYMGVFILMTLESALLPIPSEVTMTFSGYLAQTGILSLPMVVLVGATGNLVGSLIAYAIGYFLEDRIVLSLVQKYGKFILLSEHEYVRAVKWYQKYGSGITFFSRLLPAVRTFISLPAGLAQMNVWKFSIYTFLGSLLWSFVLAYIGYYLGAHWDSIGPIYNKFQLVIVVVIIVLIGYYIYRKIQRGKSKKK